MEIMDRRKRIQELKRKNEITNLCRAWMNNDISITINNFLPTEETLHLQSKIMDKLAEMDGDNTSIIYEMDDDCRSIIYQKQEMDIIATFAEELLKNIDNNKEYIFFVRGAYRIGGLVLSGNIIIEKNEFIIKESGFFDDHGGVIFFSSLDAESGVCLWRGEYDSRIYIW